MKAEEPEEMKPAMSDEQSRPDEPAESDEPKEDEAPTADLPAGKPVQDRCVVSGSCGESVVPDQPKLEFLEDMGDGWQRLLEMDWDVAAGAEGYRCKSFTIPDDIYVTALAPQVPAGTHHVAYALTDTPEREDEVYACDVRSPGVLMVDGAGVGSAPNALPQGVAMALHAGQQVHMNLHLFNPRENRMQGRSGLWVKTAPKGEIEHEAERINVGPLTLDITPGQSTHRSSCAVRIDSTVFGVGPHMHFTGVHARATVTKASGEEIVLHDGPFNWDETTFYPVEPLQVSPGDKFNVACTFQNDGDQTLHWGDSALAEMCFIGFSVYPALPYGNGPCTN